MYFLEIHRTAHITRHSRGLFSFVLVNVHSVESVSNKSFRVYRDA